MSLNNASSAPRVAGCEHFLDVIPELKIIFSFSNLPFYSVSAYHLGNIRGALSWLPSIKIESEGARFISKR